MDSTWIARYFNIVFTPCPPSPLLQNRDFVFRKIFERPPSGSDRSVQDIVDNVQELCRLDETYCPFSLSISIRSYCLSVRMFLSRTVAAEVCMEAKANEVGYAALKQLNKSHALLFDLNDLVESLLKACILTLCLQLCDVLL